MKIKVINPNTTWEMTKKHRASGNGNYAVSPEMVPVSIESYYDEYLANCRIQSYCNRSAVHYPTAKVKKHPSSLSDRGL